MSAGERIRRTLACSECGWCGAVATTLSVREDLVEKGSVGPSNSDKKKTAASALPCLALPCLALERAEPTPHSLMRAAFQPALALCLPLLLLFSAPASAIKFFIAQASRRCLRFSLSPLSSLSSLFFSSLLFLFYFLVYTMVYAALFVTGLSVSVVV